MLAAILRSERLSVAPRSRRDSSADESDSDRIITSTALSVPSIRLRRLTLLEPIFQVISSSSSRTMGSTPVIHSTVASQAPQDTVRSTTFTALDAGNAAPSTFTVSRMTASDEAEHGQRDRVLQDPAGDQGQHQRQHRKQDAVDDVVAEPDRARVGLLAPQEADEQPGQAQATEHHRQLDERGWLLQAGQQLLQLGGGQGARVGARKARRGGVRSRPEGRSERRKGSKERHGGRNQYSIRVRTCAATLRARALRL